MNDSTFHQLVDQLILNIAETLDRFDGATDIDYEIQAGIMTLSFENNTKIIINRQEPLHQVWLATKTDGFHFNYHNGIWLCDRHQYPFHSLLTEAIQAQTGEILHFI